jgi:hypothetical protein
MSFKITTLTAFISIDKNDEEGVMAFNSDQGWVPLVCADEARIKSMLTIAEDIKKMSGMPYRIIQFSVRTDVTEEIKEEFL